LAIDRASSLRQGQRPIVLARFASGRLTAATVSIRPLTTIDSGEPVAETITYVTTTKTETVREH
jgi:hypothetical protein